MWLWEDFRKEGTYRVDAAPSSPGREINDDPHAVNILPRFEPIFAPLFRNGLDEAVINGLANILLRYLGGLDFLCGLDKRELALKRLAAELDQGFWGAEPGRHYQELLEADRRILLNLLFEREKSGVPPFERALKIWFPGARLYRLHKRAEIVLAVAQPSTEDNSRKMALILDLFLPVNQEVHVFWHKTPCILNQLEASLDTCRLG